MAEPVIVSFTRRRVCCSLTLAAVSLITLGVFRVLELSRLNTALYSGILLFLLVVVLSAFNARKKAPFLPLWRAATWLQIHIYVGLFAVLLFFIHVDFRCPNGIFEGVLAAVFMLVAFSGVIGLVLSRVLPKRMTQSGEALIYERIPQHRQRLLNDMEVLIKRSEEEAQSSVLSDLYFRFLQPFMARVPRISLSLWRSDRHFQRVMREVEATRRYLNKEESALLDKAIEITDEKRNLDQQHSSMKLLRLWLFIHIPFSVSLLILGFVHGLLAFGYATRF